MTHQAHDADPGTPLLALHAMYARARALGAEFRFGETVTAIPVENGRVRGVVTDRAAGREDRVEGNHKSIRGAVGNALLFDGFTAVIDRPAAAARDPGLSDLT